MVFLITDPETGQKIKHNSSRYQKLVETKIIKKNLFIIENLILPFELPDGTVITKLLAQGNRPVFETTHPQRVVKIGFPDHPSLYAEHLFRTTFDNTLICPQYYNFGHFKIGRNIDQFPFLVMERLDRKLSIKNEAEFLSVFNHLCDILDFFGHLPNHLDTTGYAYNDFKPRNIMFNKLVNRWMLIDLETFTTIGLNKIPEFTPLYAPTNLLIEVIKLGPKNEIYTTQFTDLEQIIYTLYKAYHGDLPWKDYKNNFSKIIELRKTFLQSPSCKIDQLLKSLYNFSLTQQRNNNTELLNAASLKKLAQDFLS